MDSNLSVNIEENQPVNNLNKFKTKEETTKKATLILSDLQSSLNIEDKLIHNQVEKLKSTKDRDEKAKPNLIGQCSLNVDFNQTFNTLNKLIRAEKAVPAHSEMNLVERQDSFQLHEVVNDENLGNLDKKELIETIANSDLAFIMRSATCLQPIIQEKEADLNLDHKIDARRANQNLVSQESIAIEQKLLLQKSEKLKDLKLENAKTAMQNLEIGQIAVNVDQKIIDEKEEIISKEKINESKGSLIFEKPKRAISVQSLNLHFKEENLKQIDRNSEKASTILISSKLANINQVPTLEKEKKYLEKKIETSNATTSLNDLNALTVFQVNPQFKTGKLKLEKEISSKATVSSTKKKIAVKNTNLKLEAEETIQMEIKDRNICNVTQIDKITTSSTQNVALESEKKFEADNHKKLKAKRDLSENRQLCAQINQLEQLDTSENLNNKLPEKKKANLKIDQQNGVLQVNQKTPLELEKKFESEEVKTKNAKDKKVISLKQGLEMSNIQENYHLDQLKIEDKIDVKAETQLVPQKMLTRENILALDCAESFEDKTISKRIKSNYINQYSLEVEENQCDEKESILNTEKLRQKNLHPTHSIEELNLIEPTSTVIEYQKVQEKGK